MSEIPDAIYQQIVALCQQGETRTDEGDHPAARDLFEQAWSLLPEPRKQWDAASWIQAAIGDTWFFMGQFEDGSRAFRMALNSPDAMGNPFLHLRLGECLYELEDLAVAGDELTRAYLLGGKELFADEDPKYLAFLKNVFQPPVEGW